MAVLGIVGDQAEPAQEVRLHGALEGEQRPLLCKDPETVGLVVGVLGRALKAHADDADKARRLSELAAKLEGEICLKPAADDIVILRCNLEQKTFGDSRISLIKVSALLRSKTSAGEQPFYAWTYASELPITSANRRSAGAAWTTPTTTRSNNSDRRMAPNMPITAKL